MYASSSTPVDRHAHRAPAPLCNLEHAPSLSSFAVLPLFRYLGDRRSFQRDVARPVRLALSSEGDGRATVEGLQELEHLHRQVNIRSSSGDYRKSPFYRVSGCKLFETRISGAGDLTWSKEVVTS